MATFCAFEDNILMQCGDDYPTAGLGRFYVAPARQVNAAAVLYGDTNGEHSIDALSLLSGGEFVAIEGRVATKSLSTENTKDGGGNLHTITVEATVPNVGQVKSFLLSKFGKQKLVIIAEMYEEEGTNKKAVVLGWDKKSGADAGIDLNTNISVEAEMGGVNGYLLSGTGVASEMPRMLNATIQVDTIGAVSFGTAGQS